MASGERRSIQVHDDTYNQLYAIKGPRRSFEDAIIELINTVFPPEKEDDESQTTLAPTCPECDEILDLDGVCPGCGYPDEE